MWEEREYIITHDNRYYKQKNREDLVGEHPLGDAGQILLLLMFLAIWTADSFILKCSTFISAYFSFYFRLPLAIVTLFISGYLARSGLWKVFGEIREEPIVIREGVFSIVRHPIYLSAILLYLALLFFSPSIFASVVWFLIIVFYIYISKYEEKMLIEKFGVAYIDYMRKVPMLIPRIGRSKIK